MRKRELVVLLNCVSVVMWLSDTVNLFKPNEIPYIYQYDESISNVRGCWEVFFF